MLKKNKIIIALIVLFSLVFVFSVSMIIFETSTRQRDINTFNELYTIVEEASTSTQTLPDVDGDVTFDNESKPERNITPILEMNSDCVGWICVPGTNINYPVMHTPNAPEKYLRLSFDGRYSSGGVPFIDGRCSLDNDHLVIYGHNMKNGTMFADLKKFIDEDFFKENNRFEFQTAEGMTEYEIFSVLMIQNDDYWYFFNNAADSEEYSVTLQDTAKRSFHYTGIVPEYGTRLISLSTCYGRNNDSRLVIVGMEINK